MPENERECYLLVGGRISDYQHNCHQLKSVDPSVLQLQYWIKMAVRE